jgi:hypothetical protein
MQPFLTGAAADLHDVARFLLKVWEAPGISEFLSAVLGGAVTLAAQFIALRSDRKKEAVRAKDQQKALAWAIYFKISEANEALSATVMELREARQKADEHKVQLWQILQFPPHDWNVIRWDITELVFLMDYDQFDLMQRYQEATMWLSNLVQSVRFYRELRVEFLRSTPSDVNGDVGSFYVDQSNAAAIMPTIVHLDSVSTSLEKVITKQQPEVRQLVKDFVDAMDTMIGKRPNLTFLDEQAAA